MSCPKARVTPLLFALLCAAQAQPQQPSSEWEPITAERLRNPEPGDWLGYRRTYDVTAFSPLRQINRRTVGDLRAVWAYTMRDNSRWVATPIVANGLMYVSEGSGRVVAFDALTGELVWTHVRTYPQDIGMSEAYPRHRGVSIYGDIVYFGTADSFLVALDARTGAKLWEVQTGDYRTGEGHAHPPLIADGKVFIGTSGGDFAARGKFEAYDAANGTRLWTFYTAPRKGEAGFETWTENEQWPPPGVADPGLGPALLTSIGVVLAALLAGAALRFVRVDRRQPAVLLLGGAIVLSVISVVAQLVDLAAMDIGATEHAYGEYRLILNNGARGAQSVFHELAHVHGNIEEGKLVGI